MSSFIERKRHRHIGLHRGSQNFSRRCGNSGRNVHRVNPGSTGMKIPDDTDRCGRFSSHLPGEPGPEEPVDDGVRAKFLRKAPFSPLPDRPQTLSVSLQNPALDSHGRELPGTGCNSCRKKLNIITGIQKDPPRRDRVRAVVSLSRNDGDADRIPSFWCSAPAVIACQRGCRTFFIRQRKILPDRLRHGKRRPLHQNNGGNSDPLTGVPVRQSHLFCCQQILHTAPSLSLLLRFHSLWKRPPFREASFHYKTAAAAVICFHLSRFVFPTGNASYSLFFSVSCRLML